MEIVAKDFPVAAGDATEEYPHGTFEVILSAPTLDRDGEIIDSRAFEPLPARINFDTDHSMTCDSVVGSGVPFYDETGNLRVKGGFARDERSQIIRQKVADGHIGTTSVTFMAGERTKDAKGVPHVTKGELLNGTFTPVPSNREAVVVSAKALLASAKTGARNSASDLQLLQGAHDATVALGADCAMKSYRAAKNAMSRVDEKAIIGSVEALQDRVRDALTDAYPRGAYLRGVLPSDGGGLVVFESYDSEWNRATYQQDYTDDGSVITLTGDPVEVDVMEIVLPDADANRETDDALKSAAAPAVETAAPAAVDTAGKAADPALLALVRANENAALLAFGA